MNCVRGKHSRITVILAVLQCVCVVLVITKAKYKLWTDCFILYVELDGLCSVYEVIADIFPETPKCAEAVESLENTVFSFYTWLLLLSQ